MELTKESGKMTPNNKRFLSLIFAVIFIALLFFWGWKIGGTFFQKRNVSFFSEVPLLNTIGAINQDNFCTADIKFQTPEDEKFCFQKSRLTKSRGVELDLSNQKALLYENNKLKEVLPIAYQAKEGVWFQTPTGYFQAGVKREKHVSSFFPVHMDYAVQIYEDFFMHEIPYYDDGTRVTSAFSGGCIRFETDTAKKVFDFIQPKDQIISYKNFDDLNIKDEFHSPVDLNDFWIRQRFNSPYRQFWDYKGDLENIELDYYQHTGVDFSPARDFKDPRTYAIYDGVVFKIQPLEKHDHGLGNTIILKHEIEGQPIYSLYAHLDKISPDLSEGAQVEKGDEIGIAGNSGYGCQNYWKIGPDDCDLPTPEHLNDTHLHFEIKKSGTLENAEGDQACVNPDGSVRFCYGYTPDNPIKFGYLDPIQFLFNKN